MKSSSALSLFVRANIVLNKKGKEVKNEKMVYLPYVRFEQEEGEVEGIGWYLRSIMPKQEKVEAGTEQKFMPTVFETKCEAATGNKVL